jgi:hypothetical protein
MLQETNLEAGRAPVTLASDGHGQETLSPPGRKRAASPNWEVNGKERLRKAVRHLQKPLADAVSRDANEGDTRLLVTDLLCDGLGYDKYGDLTTEYQVRGEFADYGIRIDKQLVAFIEVKRAATKLSLKHLRQIELYAVNEGVEWLTLTNGPHWLVYHMTPGMPVTIDLALHVDLLDESIPLGQKIDRLFYLSRESLKRRQIDELWKLQAATSPQRLALALLSAPVVTAVRREIRRRTGERVEEKELVRLLRDTVLRADCTT